VCAAVSDGLDPQGRIPLLHFIRNAFDKQFRVFQKRVARYVRSAVPLRNSERVRLEALLKKRTGDGVLEISEVIDPELLGGMTIHYGDLLLDGSVRTRLSFMEREVAAPEPQHVCGHRYGRSARIEFPRRRCCEGAGAVESGMTD